MRVLLQILLATWLSAIQTQARAVFAHFMVSMISVKRRAFVDQIVAGLQHPPFYS
jgi:hypothetical protein